MAYVTVWEWERGVRFRDGALVDVLGPGRYRVRKGESIRGVDIRPSSYPLAGQEVPSADGVLLRVGLTVRVSVVDAALYVRSAANVREEMHYALQLGLRGAVLSRAHDVVDAQRREVAGEVASSVASRASELGVRVDSVDVRDVVLPVELRRALLGELVAKREGAAALERARAETAALRSLLNAARLAEEHPALLQLRMVQAAQLPGATVVFERPR
ncbi:SPFH domain-containing protein [Actinocrispum sp. NPDC049592]|uniref:SPFH domain-containing protein n=1 Tax=Actinocrispum sp. NPDC049592 TaxID=3154835 RepID=UPI003430B10B